MIKINKFLQVAAMEFTNTLVPQALTNTKLKDEDWTCTCAVVACHWSSFLFRLWKITNQDFPGLATLNLKSNWFAPQIPVWARGCKGKQILWFWPKLALILKATSSVHQQYAPLPAQFWRFIACSSWLTQLLLCITAASWKICPFHSSGWRAIWLVVACSSPL